MEVGIHQLLVAVVRHPQQLHAKHNLLRIRICFQQLEQVYGSHTTLLVSTYAHARTPGKLAPFTVEISRRAGSFERDSRPLYALVRRELRRGLNVVARTGYRGLLIICSFLGRCPSIVSLSTFASHRSE
jgi:hypothetical protein